MIGAARRGPGAALDARPVYQWEPTREPGPRTIRLFGRLGDGELRRILQAVVAQDRAPRESIFIDFSDVEHVDFRGVADFIAALARWRDRRSGVWMIGVSPYVRQLMDVSGQGALRRALSWDADVAGSLATAGGDDLRSAERRALRTGGWN